MLLSGPISRHLPAPLQSKTSSAGGLRWEQAAEVAWAPRVLLAVSLNHFAKVCQTNAESESSKLLSPWLRIIVSSINQMCKTESDTRPPLQCHRHTGAMNEQINVYGRK